MLTKGNRCDCRCHVSNGVKHIVACCCVHQIKFDCPECEEGRKRNRIER